MCPLATAQGASGISICIGKQSIYTLGAGIDPSRCLNVVLDVGTDNEQMLNDPLYLGWQHSRVRGEEYDSFIDAFVTEASKVFPEALIHCEDFGNANAARLLAKYQPKTRIFNDDIQGTGATALAAFMSAIKLTESTLSEQRVVVHGAGTAGLGIVSRMRDAMMQVEVRKEIDTVVGHKMLNETLLCIPLSGPVKGGSKCEILPY